MKNTITHTMKFKLLFILFAFLVIHSNAQNIGIGTITPDASAALEIKDSAKGFLPPRMTYAQRNAISNPAVGLMIYCTNCGPNGEWQGYNGSSWMSLTNTSATVGSSDLIISEISTAINTDVNAKGRRSHYVEIFNPTGSAINLSDYAIGYQAADTSLTPVGIPWNFSSAANYLTLVGSVAPKSCFVILSPLSDSSIYHNIYWGTTSTTNNSCLALQLSGNSAIALLKKDQSGGYTLSGNSYKIIDVFGDPNVALTRITPTPTPSSRNNCAWPIAGITDTRNRRIQRRSTVLIPTTDWNTSKGTTTGDSQWIISAEKGWDYNNVGLPTP
jgi:hypothetical protein